jgi:hypothetical protein
MATQIRKTDPNIQAFCDAHNDLKTQVGAGAFFHMDKSEATVTPADSTDLPTALVLLNAIRAVWNQASTPGMSYPGHSYDTLAHKVVDSTDQTAAPVATSLATAQTLANDIKAKYNTHRASATYHYNADSTNAVAAADATDLASLITLVNDIKAKLNAHMASGPASKSLRAVGV